MKKLLLLFSLVSCWVTAMAQCPPGSPLLSPYFEDFSTINNGATGTTFNNCWVATTSTDPNWESEKSGTANSSTTGPDVDNSFGFGNDGYYVYLETSSGSLGDTSGFISPPISLSGLTSPELSFYYHNFGANIGELEVQIWSGTQWDSLWAINGQQQTSATDAWRWANVSLASYSGNIKVKFLGSKGGSSFYGDMAIDDIRIDEATNCVDSIANVTINSVTAFEGDVIWNGNSGASSWEVHYYETGTDFYSGTTVTATTDSVRLTGLQSDTEYRVFLREACSVSGFGPWSPAHQLLTPVSCPAPTALTLNAVTTTTADLSWTTGGATSWIVEYDTLGFTPGTGRNEMVVNSATNYIITGLTAGNRYDVYVRDFCMVGDTSVYTGALTVVTNCNALTAPYSNDFESDLLDTNPLCWASYNTGSGSFVEVEDFTGTNGPHGGSQALYLYSSSASKANDTLLVVSPQFSDLIAGDKQIRFQTSADDSDDTLFIGTVASPSPTATFTPIDTVVYPTADTYAEAIIPLNTANGYNGTDEYIVFVHNLGGTYDYIRIDDFAYEQIPACSKVTNIMLDSVSAFSATFSFTATGNTFDYEWGPTGYTFGQATATTGQVTGNPATVSGFQPATTYDIYFRNNCTASSNGTSVWEGPFTFSTACYYVAPFFENFSSYTAGQLGNNITGCISGNTSTTPRWETEDSEGSNENSVSTGPFYDNTTPATSGGMYLFLECSGGSLGDSSYLTSPAIDVSALNVPYFTMAYHMYGQSMGNLKVQYSDGIAGAWKTIIELNGEQQLAGSDPWKTISAAMQNLTHDTIVFRVIGYRGSNYYSDMSIDDISIIEAPSCIPSSLLTLENDSTTTSSTFVSWSPGNGSSYEVEWGSTGYTPGSGIGSASVVDTFHTITGLSPATTYDVYVRDVCGGTSYSTYTGPVTVTTKCITSSMPYYESFDTWPLTCWEQEGAQDWIEDLGTAGDNYAVANNTGVSILNSNAISITQDAQVRFKWSHLYSSFYNDSLIIRAKVVGGSWNTVMVLSGSTFTDPGATSLAPGSFTEDAVLLDPAIYTGQDVVVQLRAISAYPDIFVNDFYVENAPACPDPFAVTAHSILDTSVVLDWGVSPSINTTEVWFGPQGFYQGTQTLPTLGARSTTTFDTLLVDTLSPKTCYEYVVRGFCAAGDTTTWIGPFQFCTPCTPYTAPYTENFDGTSTPNIDACWTVINNSTSTLSTIGTSSLYSTSSPNSVEMYYWTNPGDMMLVSPLFIDMDNQKRVRFQVYDEDDDADLYIGTMSNPSDASTFTPYDTVTADEMPDAQWGEVRYLFSSYTGNDKYIAIARSTVGILTKVFIDDFVYEAPTCFDPTNFTSTASTTTSITLDWTTGGASNWQIEYGPTGFTLGTGTKLNVGTNPYTVTGLNQATVYDFYVSDSCGTGDLSLPTGPLTVQTPCSFSLSGSYTIGAAGGYATLDSIVSDLSLCGVSGPVTVNLGGGTHNAISLGNIPGASATNTVTFMGSASFGDTINGNGNAYAIDLDNTEHVIFDGVYAQNTTGNFVVWMHNNANNISIDNCYLEGSRTTTTFTSAVVAGTDVNTSATMAGDNANNVSITNSTIVGNYYGIVFTGPSTTSHGSAITISDNDFEDQYYYGIRAYSMDSIEIHNNNIPDFRNTFSYGIYMWYNDVINITGNNIPDASTYGLYIYYPNRYLSAAPATQNLIANNMFGGGTAGLYAYSPRFINFYHNTIQGNTYGLYLSGSITTGYEDINVKNNIFTQITPSTSTLSAAFSNSIVPGGTFTLDNNLYYSPTGNIAYQSGTGYAALAAWQTAQSSYNVNSVEGDPLFYSSTDLHVLGSLANDAGDNTLGITTDIDGEARPASGSTIVDIGADEYTPVNGDLDLFAGDFQKDFYCLSSADTIVLQVKNILGSAVDFTIDPLTANYSVTGPVNSSGTITQNTGTLPAGDTLSMMATTIDLSIPGTYTLNAYLDSSAVNNLSYNDTLITVTIDVDSVFTVNPGQTTLISVTDSAELKANSPFFGGGSFFITEQCQYKAPSGQPSGGWPSYLLADDYIEITGIPGADLGGVTLEQWNATSLAGTYTFPSGTILSPNGTAIIAVGQLGVGDLPSPSDFYYHGNGTYTGLWSSSTPSGRILKDANGNIMDAVISNAFTFPAAAGVTAADWSGAVPTTSGISGNRLEGPDLNSSTGWISSATSAQNPNVINANVTAPTPTTAAGLTWTLNGVIVDSVPTITVRPSTPGSHWYVATFVSPCGITFMDSVEVIVPSCLPPSGLTGSALSASSVALNWDTTGVGAASYEVEYGAAGFTQGNGTTVNSTGNSTTVTNLAANLCQEFYLRAICGPSANSPWIGPITVCPEATICTDDMEPYATGNIDSQSALFIGWQGGAAGDATVSTTHSSSGSQSMRITDQGTAAASDVVAYFDTISSGAWEISFDMYVESNDGAYFNIQQNHDLTGVSNQWNAELYFQPSGSVQVQHSATTVTIGNFSYTQSQWFTMSTVIDLSLDTIWFEVDGNSTGIGFQYSAANAGLASQFNGVNFYSGVLTTVPVYDIDYYVDDFCVSPYVYQGCNAPVSLASANVGCDSVELSWTSLSGANNSSLIEYGPTGFTPGSGTFVSYVNSPNVITGLTPGTAYDFYVADTCGTSDTSAYAGPETVTTANGPQPFASFTYTSNGLTLDFDASGSTNGTSYDWDFGDGNSGTGVNASNTYATGGSYSIMLTVSNACGSDDTTIVISDVSLGENALEQSLVVFPNPTQGAVNVSFSGAEDGDVQIRVLDLSGKEMMVFDETSASTSFEMSIDIGKLAKGVYMLEISNGSLKANKRLVKN